MTTNELVAATIDAAAEVAATEVDDFAYDDGFRRVTLEEAIRHLPADLPYESLDDMQRQLLTLFTLQQVQTWTWRRKRRIRDRYQLAEEISKLIGWRLHELEPKLQRGYMAGRTVTSWVKSGAQHIADDELEFQKEQGRNELLNDYNEAKAAANRTLAEVDRLLELDDLKPENKQMTISARTKLMETRLLASEALVKASAEIANFEGFNKQEATINLKGRVEHEHEHRAIPQPVQGMAQLMEQARAQLEAQQSAITAGEVVDAEIVE